MITDMKDEALTKVKNLGLGDGDLRLGVFKDFTSPQPLAPINSP
jgi:hypothetical protein